LKVGWREANTGKRSSSDVYGGGREKRRKRGAGYLLLFDWSDPLGSLPPPTLAAHAVGAGQIEKKGKKKKKKKVVRTGRETVPT
jgi:hypothetical protein